MQIHVRLSGDLTSTIGLPRLALSLPEGATVADLRDFICQQYPDSAAKLQAAVPISTGRHASESEKLTDGQEIAFLLPIAGG